MTNNYYSVSASANPNQSSTRWKMTSNSHLHFAVLLFLYVASTIAAATPAMDRGNVKYEEYIIEHEISATQAKNVALSTDINASKYFRVSNLTLISPSIWNLVQFTSKNYKSSKTLGNMLYACM